MIEAARDSCERPYASAAVCLDEALQDLGTVDVEIKAEVTASLPPVSLRVILRNLLRNAARLFISIRTVDSHRAHIMLKLRLETRAELVMFALANGVIGP